jgi:hypothetical protein
VEISEHAKDLIKKLICGADQRFGRTGLEDTYSSIINITDLSLK